MAKLVSCSQEEIREIIERPEKSRRFCQELESGNIIFFDKIPFSFSKEKQDFLIGNKQTSNASRKNIAYKPHKDSITNLVASDLTQEERDKFLCIMRGYSYGVEGFLGKFLSPYESSWKLDYASFRPVQERGRNLRKRARNDLLHIDSFPSRPVHGARILRFFTNINPEEPRKWITAETFQELVDKFSSEEIFQSLRERASAKKLLFRSVKKCLRSVGIPVTLRSTYDEFMLQLHHFLKENEEYQKNCPKDYWDFPAKSCWMVFTDGLTHAALEGKYALEQTLLVPKEALLAPEKAPVSILENFSRQTMVTSSFTKFR